MGGASPGVSGAAGRECAGSRWCSPCKACSKDWGKQDEFAFPLRCGRAGDPLRSTGLRAGRREKDNIAGPYVPTPWVIVEEMLKLAGIRGEDVVYDLGFGRREARDHGGKRFGARGVGIELQTELVEMARIAAKREGVCGSRQIRAGRPVRDRHQGRRTCDAVPLRGLSRVSFRGCARNCVPARASCPRLSARPLAARQGAFDGRCREKMISGTSWTRL